MSLTEAEHEERRAYIGGTDAAALAGVNPPGWAQPIDVWLEKVGMAPPRKPSTTTMATGTLLEPVVAALFTDATGIRLRRAAQAVRSREYPWAGGHLDRWASDGAIFEAKWAMSKEGWGPGLGVGTEAEPVVIPAPDDESYRPEVPLRYAVQVQHYLAVTGRPLGYLAVLLGWGDFRWYALWRDEAMIGQLMALEETFWREHVVPRIPPEPDGSEGYGRHLRQRFRADDGLELVATPEQQLLVDALRAATEAEGVASRERARLEQLVQASMGETAKLVGPGWSISWRANRDGLSVDWEALATTLLEQAYPSAELELTLPDEWPTTKKARAELVRHVAQELGLAQVTPGARPWKPAFGKAEGEV